MNEHILSITYDNKQIIFTIQIDEFNYKSFVIYKNDKLLTNRLKNMELNNNNIFVLCEYKKYENIRLIENTKLVFDGNNNLLILYYQDLIINSKLNDEHISLIKSWLRIISKDNKCILC